MTRRQVLVWSIFLLLVGGCTLGYLLQNIPPTSSDGHKDLPVIALFLVALTLLVTGVGTLTALRLHQRWPAIGGTQRHAPAKPETALRQGFLLSVATTAIALLMLLHTLDITFILVTFLLLGLVEAYLQNRQTR